jgi:hypothetical protein
MKALTFLFALAAASVQAADPASDILKGGRLKLSIDHASLPETGAERGASFELQTRFGIIPPEIWPLLANLGEKAWDLVINNRRPLGVEFANLRAHALPQGVASPIQISPWAGPTTHHFKLEYENLLGMTMFSTESGLQFYHGAPYQDRGQHLANLTVEPTEITARIGFTGNVKVRISEPVYKAGQIASMIVTTQLDLRGPIDNITQSQSFEVKGNGEIVDLN